MSFLFRPIDNASLIYFRIIFGILAFLDIAGTFGYYHLYKDSFNPENFQFKYYGFDWVTPFPEPFMSLFFIGLLIAAVFIIIGRHYKIAATIYAFGFAYTFFLEKAHYLNHAYLFIWLCFIMIFLPVNRNFSGDVLAKPELKTNRAPYWCLFVLQFCMAVVYCYGGIAKWNTDWLMHAQPLKIWMSNKADMPVLGPIWGHTWTPWIMAWGGMLLDTFVVFFLLTKRFRLGAYLVVVFFHLTNLFVFKIGIFPWLSMGITALFFNPDFPRKVNRYFQRKFPKFAQIEEWWLRKSPDEPKFPPPTSPGGNASWPIAIFNKEDTNAYGKITDWRLNRKLVLSVLIPICVFHLLYPLRHHLIEDDVAWTEEGHRYSWRMMLRSKRAYGKFFVVNNETGERVTVRAKEYLNDKQARKVFRSPDFILQFAHFLRDEYTKKWDADVSVYAKSKLKLNHHDYYPFTIDTVDLAKEEWSFFDKTEWIYRSEIE